ncbi:hypothetical protein XELAEV_18040122mg [Xenopus laevis]|uniref:Uncharacterized protein n=1 Tax=Xenopus laevis TaxID=8355 RepID=A0A974H8L8_XENLA|nr:hypothetical protein XELAEV_18040122mg [Xenopus laevis]
MTRYVSGSVLRKHGLREVDLRKPVCFNSPWFYVRLERCIRRNNLNGISSELWCESKEIMKILKTRQEMEDVCGLTVSESKKVWENANSKFLVNRQKDLVWMSVHGCLHTRVFQRRRKLVNKNGELTAIESFSYSLMFYGLGNLSEEKSRILWCIVNCIKEALWDTRNMCVFHNVQFDENACVGLVRSRIFLYVLWDRKRLGNEAEGIWKYKKWKSEGIWKYKKWKSWISSV